VVEGLVQKRDGTVSVRAQRFWPLSDYALGAPKSPRERPPGAGESPPASLPAAPSHDFR